MRFSPAYTTRSKQLCTRKSNFLVTFIPSNETLCANCILPSTRPPIHSRQYCYRYYQITLRAWLSFYPSRVVATMQSPLLRHARTHTTLVPFFCCSFICLATRMPKTTCIGKFNSNTSFYSRLWLAQPQCGYLFFANLCLIDQSAFPAAAKNYWLSVASTANTSNSIWCTLEIDIEKIYSVRYRLYHRIHNINTYNRKLFAPSHSFRLFVTESNRNARRSAKFLLSCKYGRNPYEFQVIFILAKKKKIKSIGIVEPPSESLQTQQIFVGDKNCFYLPKMKQRKSFILRHLPSTSHSKFIPLSLNYQRQRFSLLSF